MPKFLTVKDAAKALGKSPSAVRRIIYPIIKDDAHPDRKHIEPSKDEATKLRMKGENFAWKISEEYLLRVSPVSESPRRESHDAGDFSEANTSTLVISMLQRELDIKNQQIAAQHEQIAAQNQLLQGLAERVREGNILIGTFQQQLALAAGKTSGKATTVDATPSAAEEKGNKPSAKLTKPEKGSTIPAKSPKPKRGFFSRIFR